MTRRRLGLTAAVALAVTLVPGDVALADHLRVIADVSVSPGEKPTQGYVLTVRARTTDARPLNEATVRFYELVDLFGTREMLIATAVTDGQGVGSATYLPARSGRHQIIVRLPRREHVPAAETRLSFEATVAAPPYRPYALPLSSFTAAVPYGVGVVVLFVWALIAFAFLGTARGVLRGAREHAEKGDRA